MNYDIDDLKIIDADIAEFADIMPSILKEGADNHFKFIWDAKKT